MKNIAIFISGGGSNMVSLVNAMQDKGFAIPKIVISNTPKAAGLAKAKELGVLTQVIPFSAQSPDAFQTKVLKLLDEAEVDVICLAGFMRILPAAFLEGFGKPVLNIHPSLLPKYKGLDTHQRALDARDAKHGCTVHVVTPALDDGPILGQARVDVHENDTVGTLATRVLEQEHQLYPRVLEEFVANIV